MSQKRQNDVSFNQDGGRKYRVLKAKNGFIKALAPKSMQEKESNMRLRICYTILSLGSLFGITRQSLVMPNSDPREKIVYPIHKHMIDFYLVNTPIEFRHPRTLHLSSKSVHSLHVFYLILFKTLSV